LTSGKLARLQFLARVVGKECRHLETTDRRLFAAAMTPERAASLADDADLAERVEAFVGRFGRLQDTLAEKLLPAILSALGEQAGAQIDNLDRAERLGWVESADQWLAFASCATRWFMSTWRTWRCWPARSSPDMASWQHYCAPRTRWLASWMPEAGANRPKVGAGDTAAFGGCVAPKTGTISPSAPVPGRSSPPVPRRAP
jgi:hypothetical protein